MKRRLEKEKKRGEEEMNDERKDRKEKMCLLGSKREEIQTLEGGSAVLYQMGHHQWITTQRPQYYQLHLTVHTARKDRFCSIAT